jgi:DNA repair protein RadA/Sms
MAVVPSSPGQPGGVRPSSTDRTIDGLRVVEVPDVASALRCLGVSRATKRGLRSADEG